jgi:CubicO group peptidase (beta-lactamase class C family)
MFIYGARPLAGIVSSLVLLPSCFPVIDGGVIEESTPGASGDSSGDELDTGEETEAPFDDGRNWPGEEWDEGSPEDYGMDSDALQEAREYVFGDGFNTQSVVIIKDGILIAEWYAEGTDRDTPVTTWSAGKSVTSALIGIGIRDGLLDLDDAVGSHVSDWEEGPNSELSIRHLLEMRSGLDANTDSSSGVYGEEPDQLGYSLDRLPVREPGTEFSYVNEDSMVLGEVIAQAFGQPAEEVAQEQIFEPLGLEADWWTDGEGHALTYCCIDTTARAFARFGLLYSRDGQWKADQLVPSDFVAESTTGISYSGYYGLHWWTYGEVFVAIGYHDQYLWVYPDEDLIVARFGTYTHRGEGFVREGWNYHETLDSGAFDAGIFYGRVLEALD